MVETTMDEAVTSKEVDFDCMTWKSCISESAFRLCVVSNVLL